MIASVKIYKVETRINLKFVHNALSGLNDKGEIRWKY